MLGTGCYIEPVVMTLFICVTIASWLTCKLALQAASAHSAEGAGHKVSDCAGSINGLSANARVHNPFDAATAALQPVSAFLPPNVMPGLATMGANAAAGALAGAGAAAPTAGFDSEVVQQAMQRVQTLLGTGAPQMFGASTSPGANGQSAFMSASPYFGMAAMPPPMQANAAMGFQPSSAWPKAPSCVTGSGMLPMPTNHAQPDGTCCGDSDTAGGMFTAGNAGQVLFYSFVDVNLLYVCGPAVLHACLAILSDVLLSLTCISAVDA